MNTIRIMSFNVRGAVIPDGENSWPKRADLNIRTILKRAPDLIGFQETQDGNWQEYLRNLPGFARHRGPRYNNQSPFCYPSVFWNPERLEQLDSGEFWLSKTPDHFSGDWGTACNRSACWNKFRLLPDGPTFVHLNTHLDHISEKARFEGSKVILRKLEPLMKENLPLVLTGDFNCNPLSDTHRLYIEGGFVDTFSAAGHLDGDAEFTFHAFTGQRQPDQERIDWILTRDGRHGFRTHSFEIIRDAEPPLYPSDHYPVLSEIEICPGRA
jgi:endonuclease/exonuclease/phosphatase family metal-dependent hydrolase